MNKKSTIYILKCLPINKPKYYIGKTLKHPKIRIKQHFNGNGSEWTKLYKPIKTLKIIKNCDAFDEDKYVLKYMMRYGIDNVRGGTYSTIKLSPDSIKHINKKIRTLNDECYKCGKKGHFIRECKVIKCYKCKQNGHYANECKQNGHYTNECKPSVWDSIQCFKCKKYGHYANKCKTIQCLRCKQYGHYANECKTWMCRLM
jgi:hypothetical protein